MNLVWIYLVLMYLMWMMDIPVVDDPFVTVFPISNRHLRLRKLRGKDKGDEGRKDQEIKSGRK